MRQTICPECKKGHLVPKTGVFKTTYLDKYEASCDLLVPNVTRLECNSCGEVVLDHQAMTTIEAARRKALGLLDPREIRGLRLRLGRTQEDMSELLGIGAKTYCRWESGAYVQSEGFDRYLRLLLQNPENIHSLEGIVKEKARKGHVESGYVQAVTFSYVSDLANAEDRSQIYIELMEQGELQYA